MTATRQPANASQTLRLAVSPLPAAELLLSRACPHPVAQAALGNDDFCFLLMFDLAAAKR